MPKIQTDIPVDKILEIIDRKGVFLVHRYQYRADKIRKKCNSLQKQGVLKFDGIEWKSLRFIRNPDQENQT